MNTPDSSQNIENAQESINQKKKKVSMAKYIAMQNQMLEKQSKMEERLWIDSSLTQFDDILRENYDKSLEDFSLAVITHLSRSTKAIKGAFFNVDHKKNNIYASAGYACTVDTMSQTSFQFGEGAVGQAVLTQDFHYINGIPGTFLYTEAALGQITAGAMVVVPLVFNKKVYGVIELLYLNELENKFIDLIKRLSVNIASMLQSIQSNTETKWLYQESMKQAEELKSQEEELRQNLEELSATQEEMKRKELELVGQLTAINSSCASVVFDTKGHILDVNDIFLEVTDYSLDEVKAKHHSMFVNSDFRESSEYINFWKDLANGISKRGVYKRYGRNGKEIWISASYTPVFDASGTPYKVIKIAFDITEQKISERNAIENKKLADAILDASLDGIITINRMGIIEYFNPAAQKIWGYSNEDVLGKNVKILMPQMYSRKHDGYINNYKQTGEKKIIGSGRDIELLTKDGDEVNAYLTITEAYRHGKPVFIGFVKVKN